MFNKIYEKIKEFIKGNYKDLIFIFVFAFIMLYNFPYVIYRPGGAINLNERVKVNNNYETSGSYSMNYVTVSKANLPTIILSFLINDWDLMKESMVVYENTDYETTFEIEKLDMQSSIDTAIMTAYNKAGIGVKIKSIEQSIIYLDENADTNLEVLDKINSLDGHEFTSVLELQNYVQEKNVGDKVTINVNDNEEKYAHVYEYEGRKILGVSIISNYEYDLDPKLTIESKATEAGSSGGLMLTLAIYDKLIAPDLTRGKAIMGTGTINEDETVGPIGGVKYKLLGAENNKADVFFVPEANYEEAKKVYDEHKLSFDLVMVKTLDDAINYLKTL